MQNLDVKKRLKAFDEKITLNLANNEIITDAEDPPEGWHIDDAADLDDPYIPYDPEDKIPETDYYTKEALDKYLT